jgi:NTE family protein
MLDGGLADNVGLRSLSESLISPRSSWKLLKAINTGQVKLVVIVVNARSDAANDLYQTATRPGVVAMVQSVTSVPIDAATAEQPPNSRRL